MPTVEKINKISRNLFVIFLFVLLITKCQDNSSKHNLRNGKQFNRLELVWTNLGDANGKEDMEMDDAATESAEFSPNGKYIVSGARHGDNLRVWETKKGNMIFNHKCEDEIEAVTFSPDNSYFLAGGEFNKLLIWSVEDWSLIKEIKFNASVEGLRYSHSGNILAVGDEAGIITLIENNSFDIINSIKHGEEVSFTDTLRKDVNSLDFSEDDMYLVSGGIDGKIKIWFIPDLKLIKTIDAHKSSIKSVRINHNRNCIATASSESYWGSENSIKIWDFKSGNLLHTLTFPFGMEAVEFTPDGRFMFGGGNETNNLSEQHNIGHIYVYYIPDDVLSQPVKQIHEEPVFRSEYLNVNRAGDKLISSHEDGTIRLWNIIYN